MRIYAPGLDATSILQHAIRQIRQDSAARQLESITGSHADIGLRYGSGAGKLATLRAETGVLQTYRDANALSHLLLDAGQQSLQKISDTVSGLRNSVISLVAGGNSNEVRLQARNAIDTAISDLNSSVGGRYIFAGTNSNQAPIAGGYDATSASRLAVLNAFATHFGFPVGDPAAAAITPVQMTAFIQGPLASVFAPAGWTAAWSSASDDTAVFRVAPGQEASGPPGANAAEIRGLMHGLVVLAEFSGEPFSAATRQAAVNEGLDLVAGSVQDVTALVAQTGRSQENVLRARDLLDAREASLNKTITVLESVDPYEAATRVSELQSQLETAYALTARTQKLLLVNFL